MATWFDLGVESITRQKVLYTLCWVLVRRSVTEFEAQQTHHKTRFVFAVSRMSISAALVSIVDTGLGLGLGK